MTYDAIVVGAGLSGLAAAFDLVEQGQKVLLLEAAAQVGGRTSNWKQGGMDVESGVHKFIGIYTEVPKLLRHAGIDLNDVFIYQDEMEIRVAEGGDRNNDPQRRRRRGFFGMSLLHRPLLTMRGLFGNRELLSWGDKWSLMRVMAAGVTDYMRDRQALDRVSLADYARRHGGSDNVINTVLYSLSGGLFFLPPERYSAYAFFALVVQSIKRSYRSRLAIFRGGMTDVMAAPVARAIEQRGGEVLLGVTVTGLAVESGSIAGVTTTQSVYHAPRVILATTIGAAKKIVAATFYGDVADAELQKLLALPDMPGVAVQLELRAPALPDDHLIFGPNSILGTFGEQSRTTFSSSAGRISAFLSPSESFMTMADEAVIAAVVADLKRQGVDVTGNVVNSAVVRHPSEFYLLSPGSEEKRPLQRTSIKGLALAGDYTKQPFICSMEGAVLSGRLAAAAVLD